MILPTLNLEKVEMQYNQINKVILFGGAPLLIKTLKKLISNGLEVRVYTSERHLAEVLDKEGKTLKDYLEFMEQPYIYTDCINSEETLRSEITENTMGIGLGEPWSFDKELIDLFQGRLLDFMGIPHPRYRGGAHYTWMILRGDKQGACNLQVINEHMIQGKFDNGEIVKSLPYNFPKNAKTPMDYFNAATEIEAGFISNFIAEINEGFNFELKKPDEAKSLFLPRLNTIKQGWINWTWSGQEIEQFISAFDEPYAGASTLIMDNRVHLKNAKLIGDEPKFHPFQSGLITRIHDKKVYVATSCGHLEIQSILDENGQNIIDTLELGMRMITPQKELSSALLYNPDYGTKINPN